MNYDIPNDLSVVLSLTKQTSSGCTPHSFICHRYPINQCRCARNTSPTFQNAPIHHIPNRLTEITIEYAIGFGFQQWRSESGWKHRKNAQNYQNIFQNGVRFLAAHKTCACNSMHSQREIFCRQPPHLSTTCVQPHTLTRSMHSHKHTGVSKTWATVPAIKWMVFNLHRRTANRTI